MPLPDWIRHGLFWIAVLAFALAQVALLTTSLRAPGPPEGSPNRVRLGRRAELAMLLASAALTALLLVFTWRTLSASAP